MNRKYPGAKKSDFWSSLMVPDAISKMHKSFCLHFGDTRLLSVDCVLSHCI